MAIVLPTCSTALRFEKRKHYSILKAFHSYYVQLLWSLSINNWFQLQYLQILLRTTCKKVSYIVWQNIDFKNTVYYCAVQCRQDQREGRGFVRVAFTRLK